MPEQVRLWRVGDGDRLEAVGSEPLDFEQRLEDWIAGDVTLLGEDLLVVGRQVATDYGGAIDLLCLDQQGDCVIVELKRGMTPREVTAQALDYASWVSGLSGERIVEIADEYLGKAGPLDDAFRHRFGTDLPDVLNAGHSVLVVGSRIDASTERIIRYLAGVYGVGINAVTFQHFRTDTGDELLSRLVMMEQASDGGKAYTKRPPNLTFEELHDIAVKGGVGALYEHLVAALSGSGRFQRQTTRSSIAFTADIEGSRKTVFSLVPKDGATDQGLSFQVYTNRMCAYTGLTVDQLRAALPSDSTPWTYASSADPDWSGESGHFRSEEECDRFLRTIGIPTGGSAEHVSPGSARP